MKCKVRCEGHGSTWITHSLTQIGGSNSGKCVYVQVPVCVCVCVRRREESPRSALLVGTVLCLHEHLASPHALLLLLLPFLHPLPFYFVFYFFFCQLRPLLCSFDPRPLAPCRRRLLCRPPSLISFPKASLPLPTSSSSLVFSRALLPSSVLTVMFLSCMASVGRGRFVLLPLLALGWALTATQLWLMCSFLGFSYV